VVQANLLAATTTDPAAVNQVYNVALNAQTTLDELFLMIRMLLAPSYPAVMERQPVYRDFRPGDMRTSQADISKAQSLLGYRPAWEVREGMKWAIDWYVSTLASSLPVVGDALEQAVNDAEARNHVPATTLT
jgi:UDP-N-acetylglucosamine 4-epimerase